MVEMDVLCLWTAVLSASRFLDEYQIHEIIGDLNGNSGIRLVGVDDRFFDLHACILCISLGLPPPLIPPISPEVSRIVE